MYSPTTSRTFATNWGSGDILYERLMWGLSPNVRQILPTIVWLIPAFAAIVRVLQCVCPFGVVSSVLTMSASTCSSVIVRGPPTRGSSYKPSSRRAMKRSRHFPTVCPVVRARLATSALETAPASAQARMSRARNAMSRFTRDRFVS